jgi:antitoxin (DNA-binding transcriptional repressor) of toxin-antitoxin stability system
MTYILSFEEAQPKFAALIEQATHGDEIMIVHSTQPIARIIPPATFNIYPSLTSQSGGLTRIIAYGDAPARRFTEPNSNNAVHAWEYRIGTTDLATNFTSWTAPIPLPAIMGASGTTTIPTPLSGQIIEIRDNMTIQLPSATPPNILAQAGCTAFVATGVSPQYTSLVLAAFRSKDNASSQQAAVGNSNSAFTIECSPNPASSSLTISYTLEEAAQMNIEVFDALQRRMLQPLTNHTQEAGRYSMVIPVETLTNGTYSIRLTTRTANGTMRSAAQQLIIIH